MPSGPSRRPPQFTPQADSDLDEIEAYIAEDNPQAARRLIERIRDVCFTLAEQPYMGVARPRFGPGYRIFTVPGTRYIIVYRPADEGVQILHIRPGSQDLIALFE